MANPIIWLVDPETGEDVPVLYSDLEDEAKEQLFAKPLGGFVFPAGVFIERKLPACPFYLKDWLPKRGKALLYAPPKSGKSFLCLQLARCIGAGEDFLGIPTTQGSVLYVQFELGEEVLQGRLISTRQDYENVFVGTSFSIKLDTPGGQEQLWRAMKAVEPNVLILDPWYKAITGDENEANDAMKILDFLDNVIEGFNCSIFIIHHAGKDIGRRGRGSSVLEDWVDSYLQLTKLSKEGEALKVRIRPIFLRHAALPPEPVEAVMQDNFEFESVGATKSVKQQIVELIKIRHQVEAKEIFAARIGSNTSVYRALSKLVKEGVISKVDFGTYQYNKGG